MFKPSLAIIALFSLAAAASSALAGESGLKVVDHIKVGGDGGWDYATFDPATRLLYVAHGAVIVSINVDTHAVNPKAIPSGGAHIALPIDGGARLVVTNGAPQTATINDAKTGAVQATIKTGKKPDAAVLEPVTGLVYVMENGGGVADVIDPKTGAQVATIKVGGALEFAAVDGAGKIFVNVEDKNQLVALDAKTNTVAATYPLAGCDEPSGLAYVAPTRQLLVACANDVAKVISADTGADVATLKIGSHPDAAFYDPAAARGYVPSGDGKLAVVTFGADGPKVIDIVITQKGARTGAVDPKTGLIYLPTAQFGAPATAGGRPTVVPGSFEIVVVGK